MRGRRLGLAGLLALTLGGAAGCHRDGAARTFPHAPIILVSIDTLRSDHLPAYGYQGVATPALDALRRDSILYQRAYSHVPLTLPSHVSLLTGLLPGEHGVRDNLGYRFEAARFPHLSGILRPAGYATGGAVSAFVLRPETGINADFDFYDGSIDVRSNEALGHSQRAGRITASLAKHWIHTVKDRPFFCFLHLYEPHTPYDPPEPYRSRYAANLYDGEIANADSIVGDFLQDLKAQDLYERSIVVLLSDHGEGLWEHGEQEHGVLLYREALQVPLLLKLPGGRLGGTSVAASAQLIDVLPTLLQLIGVPAPAGLPGSSLLDLERAGAPDRAVYSETYYPRLHLGWSELTSLVRGDRHYIQGPDPELYDLQRDPGEKKSVLGEERRSYNELRTAMSSLLHPLQAPAAASDEERKQLAALGYLGNAVADTDGPLPDPKSRVASLKDLGRALTAFNNQHFAEAAPLLESLVQENPKMVDAWENLGLALERLGQRERALGALTHAMEVSGGSPHVALSTAALLVEMKRLDEAEKHARLALGVSPSLAHNLLAQIALARKKPEEAEREAQAALQAGGSRAASLVTLAWVLQESGRLEEALKATQQAIDALAQDGGGQRAEGLYYVRGDVLARLGRNGEAEECLRREIQQFPSDLKPYPRLAILYALEGRAPDAVAMLRAMVEANRSPVAYAEAVTTLRLLGDPAGAGALLRYARRLFPENPELRALGG